MTRGAPSGLPAQAELFDDGAIPPHIIAIEVTQEPSPLADHLQKAAPRRMIVLMLPEVIREFGDPSREDSHLDLDRAFIGRVPPVFLDYRRLRRLVQLVSVSCEFPQIKYRTARWNRTRVSAIYTGLFVENPHAKKRRPRGRTKYNTQAGGSCGTTALDDAAIRVGRRHIATKSMARRTARYTRGIQISRIYI